MDGEINGTQTQGEEQQGQSVEQAVDDQQPQQQPQAEVTVSGDGDGNDGVEGDGNGPVSEDEYRAALAERDKQIKQLEAQIAEASKTVESANALAKQIEDLKASADAERIGFELKLAGCRSVRAGRVLLADHDGDMEALKAAEPWLFGDAQAGNGGATGLEPAGAASGGDDELKRWYRIAGIEVEE